MATARKGHGILEYVILFESEIKWSLISLHQKLVCLKLWGIIKRKWHEISCSGTKVFVNKEIASNVKGIDGKIHKKVEYPTIMREFSHQSSSNDLEQS